MVSFQPGTYTIKITGTSGAQIRDFSVDVVLVDPCFTVDLNLQPTPFIDQQYVLVENPLTQPWQAEDLISPLTQVDCGPISVEIFPQSGGLVDTQRFFDDRSAAPANEFRTLFMDDPLLIGSFAFLYRVYHTNYVGN